MNTPTMLHTRFIEPLDVLFLRGNRLFGEPGSHGESLLPPWPSVAAGALRALHHAETGKVLDRADDFRLCAFGLGRRQAGQIEAIHALPADLSVTGSGAALHIRRLHPTGPAPGVLTSSPLPRLPVLAIDEPAKPQTGLWLSAAGWQHYLAGETPDPAHLIPSSALWELEHRVGVGLEAATRRAEDGKLFSMQAIHFQPGVGFIAACAGRVPPPAQGTLRFGGDGRGAHLSTVAAPLPAAAHDRLQATGRARLVLTTPGLFPDGWRLPGMQDDGSWELGGVRARVVAAAVPRAETISGWDMRARQPKPAQRAVPTGSVYWLDDLQASTDALDKLASHGLWARDGDDESRRIEGFNRFVFAAD